MRKFINKLICFTVCAATVAGLSLTAGCSSYYKATALDGDYSTGVVQSNGGFAVKKGNYVYFINGSENSDVDNTYGTPVKGAIMRISTQDFADRNYANVQTVVPQVVYSGDYTSGIYVYGDRVYYSTPSTAKNSDGEVLNTQLDFKSAKLNGEEAMSNSYYTSTDNAIAYRYVQVDDTVYLMYVISEDLYETGTSVTNIHSVNTETGENTLLAYNVASYKFDEKDVENPTVYYTMNVNRYIGKEDVSNETYNQIYKVTADDTTANEYDFSYLEDYDAEVNPVYVNCGELVFDGIGLGNEICQFNGVEKGYALTNSAYTYTLISYETVVKGSEKVPTLFYSRKPVGESVAALYTVTDAQVAANTKNAVEFNPSSSECLLQNATGADAYEFVNVNGVDKIISTDASTTILMGQIKDGVIAVADSEGVEGQFPIVTASGAPETLFIDGSYLYYSVAGENVYRVAINGTKNNYNKMPTDDNIEYEAIKVLEIDTKSGWYKPELIDGQLIYLSDTETMSAYNYVEVCDLRNADGSNMTNADIKAQNELYEEIFDKIADFSATDYENLQNALKYAFYSIDGDYEYISEVIQASVDIDGKEDDYYYTEETLNVYWDFVYHTEEETSVWAEYGKEENKKALNDETVAANRQGYYYNLLGVMTEADAEAYTQAIKDTYIVDLAVDETTWWQGLTTVAKVFFIIGVVLGGLIVLGAIAFVVFKLVAKNKTKKPVYRKAKRVIDTTDDKNIDVYNDED